MRPIFIFAITSLIISLSFIVLHQNNSLIFISLIIMIRITKILYRIGRQHDGLNGILGSHICSILQQDQASANPKYSKCYDYFQNVLNSCQREQAKLKCNMIFNAHCNNDSISHLRPTLSDMVISGVIRSQYELDQVIKWLLKEIKVNKNVDRVDIMAKLSKRKQEQAQFERQLKSLKQSQTPADINQVCKCLRQKFFTIDSKLIFSRVKQLLCAHQQKVVPKKDNKLWDKLQQIKPRRIKEECNSKQIYDQHLTVTEGKPRFRFPPEPNGYLHIGHAKSIRVNFESAMRMGGVCYLRYDDTNPDKETHEFIQEIQQNVRWLGYNPDKITFASDYFEQILHYAHQLVRKGHAYVCDSPQEEIELERKHKQTSPYRNRTVEQSLKIFPHLAHGQTLRLKALPDSANPTLRDPIIYRVKHKAHPRTGTKYSIYPMYDFTHCICDSLEHIDYSLCSLQFQIRRQLYYTILDLLGLYKPVVWQYSRLNVEGNVLSKRTIKQLIEKGVVEGWDDARLLTLRGLRNRGYTPEMVKEFIDKVNCSRAGNENVVQYSLLQKEMKKVLLNKAYKTMGVINPLPSTVDNLACFQSKAGFELENEIFIQKEDAQKLRAGDTVILKSAGACTVTQKTSDFVKFNFLGHDVNVSQLRKQAPSTKILHWIPKHKSHQMPVVFYDRLLDSKGQINPQSKIVCQNSRIDPLLLSYSNSQYFQLERIGFFKLSPDKKELRLCARF